MKNLKLYHYFLIAIGIIALDQASKILVYNTMSQGDEIKLIGDVLKIHYITNPGMAFGIEIAGDYGKIILTLFRLVAMFFIAHYMRKLYQKKAHPGFQICVAMIFAGAIGNLIDSVIYGVALDLVVPGANTAWFHGEVIDMIYVDIAQGFYPDWVPVVGGDYYSFWPIFNVADSSIFVAVCVILIFQKKFFGEEEKAPKNEVKEEQREEVV